MVNSCGKTNVCGMMWNSLARRPPGAMNLRRKRVVAIAGQQSPSSFVSARTVIRDTARKLRLRFLDLKSTDSFTRWPVGNRITIIDIFLAFSRQTLADAGDPWWCVVYSLSTRKPRRVPARHDRAFWRNGTINITWRCACLGGPS